MDQSDEKFLYIDPVHPVNPVKKTAVVSMRFPSKNGQLNKMGHS
jgi:hypothetical protein